MYGGTYPQLLSGWVVALVVLMGWQSAGMAWLSARLGHGLRGDKDLESHGSSRHAWQRQARHDFNSNLRHGIHCCQRPEGNQSTRGFSLARAEASTRVLTYMKKKNSTAFPNSNHNFFFIIFHPIDVSILFKFKTLQFAGGSVILKQKGLV